MSNPNSEAIPLRSAYQLLSELRDEQLVVCSGGTAGGEWHAASKRHEADMKISMSMASMFALGMALSIPEANLWVFDGDGSLAMNAGVLMTEAQERPRNMVHFVLVNRVYGATGNLEIPGSSDVDFAALGRASGIERVFYFSNVDRFKTDIGDILAERDFAYVVLEIEAQPGARAELPIDEVEQKYRFVRYLERTYSRQIFNKWGY